jgi:NhaP-type Na+/H+ and K+/H+ antiporter
MTYFKRVIRPTIEAIVFGFIITSLLVGLVVLFTPFPYLPQYILLGNVIGSLPWLFVHHCDWKRARNDGVAF